MKTIKKFVAIDGVEFLDKDKCLEYEKLIGEIRQIMSSLPDKPDTCDFSNGSGYIKHDKESLERVKISLLNICKIHTDHKWIQQTIDDDTVHLSFAGRLIEEIGIRPLSNAWGRLMCIDNESREWGQSYYASHPDEAIQKQLN